ncbi:hypothetical protein [uncultured Alistipes sp.]|uniref:hypothetical protein n=1 Tax=uncultured Alistipes sp. TaxID=538949 RepID=UPI0025B22D1A|nr:hypothetical protein [uncultured Alistipes sp.]
MFPINYSLFIFSVIHSSDCWHTPAAGYRFETTGALTHVGEWGLCWSSSSYAAGQLGSGYLYLNADNVNPLNHGRRASTLSVRCVQHLRAVFYLFQRPKQKKSGGGTTLQNIA